MTIRDDVLPTDLVSRHQMRLERQARVGILRNLREPPRVPARKAPLTGKWLDMRSRRRLRQQSLEPALLRAVADTAVELSLPGETAAGGNCVRDAAPAAVPSPSSRPDRAMAFQGEAPAAGARRLRFLAGFLTGLVLAALGAMVAGLVLVPAG